MRVGAGGNNTTAAAGCQSERVSHSNFCVLQAVSNMRAERDRHDEKAAALLLRGRPYGVRTASARHLARPPLGPCTVVAPSPIPGKPGDWGQAYRRDAIVLAQLVRAGEFTPVWVPDDGHEALRDLVRARAPRHLDHRGAAVE